MDGIARRDEGTGGGTDGRDDCAGGGTTRRIAGGFIDPRRDGGEDGDEGGAGGCEPVRRGDVTEPA